MSTTSIVVIGSGIVGAAAAHHLARLGVSVTVVDRGDPGQATAAGAGIICPWTSHADDDAWYRLSREAARRYPDLMAEIAEEDGQAGTGYATVGALAVSADQAELDAMEALLRRRAAEAPEMGEVTSLADPRGLVAPLAPGLGAVHVAGAARIDGRVVRDGLLRAAVRLGAEVRSGAATLGRSPCGGPRVTVGGDVVEAEAVIVAAGAWSRELCAPLGHRLPVGPQRGQIVHAVLPGADTGAWPIVLPTGNLYLLGFPGSRVVFGATREDAGFDHRVTVGGLGGVLAAGVSLAPGLADATLVETRVGFRPRTEDGRPLIGLLEPGVVVATGLGANGLTTGPFTGLIAAGLALGERPPLDLAAFSPAR